MRLKGRVLLISGASGIAAATARLAIAEGAQVLTVSLLEEHSVIAEELGNDCDFYCADLSIASSAEQAVRQALIRFGRLDALYNVAGISGRRYGDGPLHECSEEGWDATVNNNLKTMFLLSRAALKHFLMQPIAPNGLRGTILNMSSVLAFSPQPDFFATHAYATTKGGVIALTKSMAAYYARFKINVNAVAPALVRTPMSQRAQADPTVLQYVKRKQPLAEDMLAAEDVAQASLFLLSDEARFITGEVLTIDGGWRVSGA